MQKHKWLTKWSSQYGKCLKQIHNEKQGDGQNLVFCLAIFTCLCACISNLLWWMFAFRLTGDGRNLRRQLDCSDPLIFIPPTHRSGSQPSLPCAPFRKVNVLIEIRCFAHPAHHGQPRPKKQQQQQQQTLDVNWKKKHLFIYDDRTSCHFYENT